MAVVEIAKILVRRGQENQTGMPQLDSGEFGWAEDTEHLYIGKRIVDGATNDRNTRILTEGDLDNIFNLLSAQSGTISSNNNYYRYREQDAWIHSTGTTVQNKLDQFVSLSDYGVKTDVSVVPVAFLEDQQDVFGNIISSFNTTSWLSTLTLVNSILNLPSENSVLVVSMNLISQAVPPTTFSAPVLTIGSGPSLVSSAVISDGPNKVSQGVFKNAAYAYTAVAVFKVPTNGLPVNEIKIYWPSLESINASAVSITATVNPFVNVELPTDTFSFGSAIKASSTGTLITPIGPLNVPVGGRIFTSFIQYIGTVDDGNGPNPITVNSSNNRHPYYLLSGNELDVGTAPLPGGGGSSSDGLFYASAFSSGSFEYNDQDTIVGDNTLGNTELNFTSGVAFVLPGVVSYSSIILPIADKMQNAIDDIFLNTTSPIDSRRELLIPAGTYSIDASVDLPSFTRLKGAGMGITNLILTNAATDLFRTVGVDQAGNRYYWDETNGPGSDLGHQTAAVRPKEISLEGMTLLHSSTLTNAALLSLDNVRGVRVKDVDFSSTNEDYRVGIGMRVRGQGGDFTVSRINDGYTQDINVTSSKFSNLYVGVECTGTVIRPVIHDNLFNNLNRGATFLTLDDLPGPSDGFVTENRFQNVEQEAVWVGANPNNFRSNICTSDNFFGAVGTGPNFKDFITTSSGACPAIRFDSSGNKTVNDVFSRKILADQGLGSVVDSISIISTGLNGPYDTSSTVTISSPDIATGVQASAELVFDESNYVTAINMVEKGYGYLGTPTITISGFLGSPGDEVITSSTVVNNFFYVPYVVGEATIDDLSNYRVDIAPESSESFVKFPITNGPQKIDIRYQIKSDTLARTGNIQIGVASDGYVSLTENYNYVLDVKIISTSTIYPDPSSSLNMLNIPVAGNDWAAAIPATPTNYYVVGSGVYDGLAAVISNVVIDSGFYVLTTVSDPAFDYSNTATSYTVGISEIAQPDFSYVTNKVNNYVELSCSNPSVLSTATLEYQTNIQLL